MIIMRGFNFNYTANSGSLPQRLDVLDVSMKRVILDVRCSYYVRAHCFPFLAFPLCVNSAKLFLTLYNTEKAMGSCQCMSRGGSE